MIMVMLMYIYIPHILHSLMAVYNIVIRWGEIGPQRVKAPLAATISPCFDLTHPRNLCMNQTECERQMKSEIEIDHHTTVYVPYSFQTVCGFFNVLQIIRNKCCEMGSMDYDNRPYLRRLESLTGGRCHYKGSTF